MITTSTWGSVNPTSLPCLSPLNRQPRCHRAHPLCPHRVCFPSLPPPLRMSTCTSFPSSQLTCQKKIQHFDYVKCPGYWHGRPGYWPKTQVNKRFLLPVSESKVNCPPPYPDLKQDSPQCWLSNSVLSKTAIFPKKEGRKREISNESSRGSSLREANVQVSATGAPHDGQDTVKTLRTIIRYKRACIRQTTRQRSLAVRTAENGRQPNRRYRATSKLETLL